MFLKGDGSDDGFYNVHVISLMKDHSVYYLLFWLDRIRGKPTINDDTIPGGTVHIGLLYNIHVSNKEVYNNETDKMTADWIDKSNLVEFYEGMETWTKITFDFYIKWKNTLTYKHMILAH